MSSSSESEEPVVSLSCLLRRPVSVFSFSLLSGLVPARVHSASVGCSGSPSLAVSAAWLLHRSAFSSSHEPGWALRAARSKKNVKEEEKSKSDSEALPIDETYYFGPDGGARDVEKLPEGNSLIGRSVSHQLSLLSATCPCGRHAGAPSP